MGQRAWDVSGGSLWMVMSLVMGRPWLQSVDGNGSSDRTSVVAIGWVSVRPDVEVHARRKIRLVSIARK